MLLAFYGCKECGSGGKSPENAPFAAITMTKDAVKLVSTHEIIHGEHTRNCFVNDLGA